MASQFIQYIILIIDNTTDSDQKHFLYSKYTTNLRELQFPSAFIYTSHNCIYIYIINIIQIIVQFSLFSHHRLGSWYIILFIYII